MEATAKSLAQALNNDDAQLATIVDEYEKEMKASFQYDRVIYGHPAYDYEATDGLGFAYIADGCKYATKDGLMVKYNHEQNAWEDCERPAPSSEEDN